MLIFGLCEHPHTHGTDMYILAYEDEINEVLERQLNS